MLCAALQCHRSRQYSIYIHTHCTHSAGPALRRKKTIATVNLNGNVAFCRLADISPNSYAIRHYNNNSKNSQQCIIIHIFKSNSHSRASARAALTENSSHNHFTLGLACFFIFHSVPFYGHMCMHVATIQLRTLLCEFACVSGSFSLWPRQSTTNHRRKE